jgi:hypothetical protein
VSRSTQYIGLNKYAKDWLEQQGIIEEFPRYLCDGMFNEEIYGKVYHVTPPEGPNVMYVCAEVVQDIPWSSGPMIFTYLKVDLVKMEQKVPMGDWFQWMVDPGVTNEVDYERGRYFV